MDSGQLSYISSVNPWFAANALLKSITSNHPSKKLDLTSMSRTELLTLGDEFIDELLKRVSSSAKEQLRSRLTEILDLPPTEHDLAVRRAADACAQAVAERQARGDYRPGEINADGYEVG